MSAPLRFSLGRGVAGHRSVRRETIYPWMILGAGCAGLSLAWNLLELGVEEPILVVDRRDRFENDRTWCFWDVEPTPFSDLASHAWTRWMVHDDRRETIAECQRYRYLRVRSSDVYRRVLDRLASSPNVTLALGQPIQGISETDRGVTVATLDGEFRGLRAFDSSGRVAASAFSAIGPRSRRPSLLQHFFGQTIRVDRTVFDPTCPTLMDFRAAQDDGPHFFYLLPFSTTEALVENTYLFPFDIGPERHRREIAAYLQRRYDLNSGSFEVIEEESGAIPMSLAPNPVEASKRVVPIGLSGGAARPSSGYAFVRIQRQARWLAERLVAGERLDPGRLRRSLGPGKYRFFDAVFLQTLADCPSLAPAIFQRMFDRAEPAALVRFLSERSTLADDLQIVAALPKTPFMTAALRSVPDWLPTFRA